MRSLNFTLVKVGPTILLTILLNVMLCITNWLNHIFNKMINLIVVLTSFEVKFQGFLYTRRAIILSILDFPLVAPLWASTPLTLDFSRSKPQMIRTPCTRRASRCVLCTSQCGKAGILEVSFHPIWNLNPLWVFYTLIASYEEPVGDPRFWFDGAKPNHVVGFLG